MQNQLLILGTPWNLEEIRNSISELQSVHLVTADTIDKANPLLCLYFGKSIADANINADTEKMLKQYVNQRCIQPIASEPNDFKTTIPIVLKDLNGFFRKEGDKGAVQRLKNLVATFLGLVNVNKKVFISYRRTDLEPLAQELYVCLVKRKYNPFLDAYSITEGVDFQEHLRHELVDSDIIILLDSPDFNSSEYCMEEFNIANQERIPVLDIRFSVNPKTNMHRFCDYLETGKSCMEANTDKNLPNTIIDLMERCRVKAYQFKRQYILDEFAAVCHKYGIKVTDQGGFLRSDTSHECFYPLTRIPTAKDMFDVYLMFRRIPLFSTYSKQILYNGNYCRQDVSSHLQWLDMHLPIKSFNITR